MSMSTTREAKEVKYLDSTNAADAALLSAFFAEQEKLGKGDKDKRKVFGDGCDLFLMKEVKGEERQLSDSRHIYLYKTQREEEGDRYVFEIKNLKDEKVLKFVTPTHPAKEVRNLYHSLGALTFNQPSDNPAPCSQIEIVNDFCYLTHHMYHDAPANTRPFTLPAKEVHQVNGVFFKFAKPGLRSKNQFNFIMVYHENSPPDSMVPNVLYLKKGKNGRVTAYAIVRNELKEHILDKKTVALCEERSLNLDTNNTQTEIFDPNEGEVEIQKFCSEMMRICGFVSYSYKRVNYAALRGSGTFGSVYTSVGFFERTNTSLTSTETATVVKKMQRTPRAQENKQEAAVVRMIYPQTSKLVRPKNEDFDYLVQPDFGVTLLTFLNSKAVSFSDKLKIMVNLINELEKVHKKRKVHYDIKPENILINPDTLEVKIIDFGFNQWQGDIVYGISGTREYIAPELAGSQSYSVDPAADVLSLGCVFRQMFYDKNYQKRVDHLSSIHKKYPQKNMQEKLGPILGAEYFLDICMEAPDLPVSEEKIPTEQIAKILEGMTTPRPENRLSLADARKMLLSLQGLQPAEDKIVPMTKPFALEIKNGIDCINNLDQEQKLFLQAELRNKIDHLKTIIGSNLRENFFDLLDGVPVASPKFANMMAFVSDFLFKLKQNPHAELKREKENLKGWLNIILPSDVVSYPESESKSMGNDLADNVENNGEATSLLKQLRQSNRVPSEGVKKISQQNNDNIEIKTGLLKKAWNETFFPDKTPEEHKTISGWLYGVKFVTNIYKLPEFIFNVSSSGAASGITYQKNKLKDATLSTKILIGLFMIPLGIGWVITKPLHILTRTVTSPVTSFKEARKIGGWRGKLLAGCSLLASAAGLVGLGLALAPLLAALLPAKIVAALSGVGSIPVIGSVLNISGLTTAALQASAVVSVGGVAAAALIRGGGGALLTTSGSKRSQAPEPPPLAAEQPVLTTNTSPQIAEAKFYSPSPPPSSSPSSPRVLASAQPVQQQDGSVSAEKGEEARPPTPGSRRTFAG